jgi:hypothetical protein
LAGTFTLNIYLAGNKENCGDLHKCANVADLKPFFMIGLLKVKNKSRSTFLDEINTTILKFVCDCQIIKSSSKPAQFYPYMPIYNFCMEQM